MQLFLIAALVTSIPRVQAPEPNRQPQLASVPGLTAVVFGSGSSIWFSSSHDDGRTFLPPTKVARIPVLGLGRHRGPRVVISGATIVISAAYTETKLTGEHTQGFPFNGDLLTWRSNDEGRTWSKPLPINDAPESAREGLHAMAVGNAGEMAAVWLDARSAGTHLYGAYSKDRGVTWSKNVLIYEAPGGTICQCCDPSIAFSGKHAFNVMFRNVMASSRDMYLATWNLDGQISKPEKLGTGSWKIDACPMDGGGLTHRGAKTVTAWRREHTVYLDEPNQAEVALGEGKDVALTLSTKGPYVAWSGPSGIELRQPDTKQSVSLSRVGGFPALAALANGSVLAAWEQDGNVQLQVIE